MAPRPRTPGFVSALGNALARPVWFFTRYVLVGACSLLAVVCLGAAVYFGAIINDGSTDAIVDSTLSTGAWILLAMFFAMGATVCFFLTDVWKPAKMKSRGPVA